MQKEARAQRAADSFETIAREWYSIEPADLGSKPCKQDHQAARGRRFPLAGLQGHCGDKSTRPCSRCCGESKAEEPLTPRTGRAAIAARYSATPFKPDEPSATRFLICAEPFPPCAKATLPASPSRRRSPSCLGPWTDSREPSSSSRRYFSAHCFSFDLASCDVRQWSEFNFDKAEWRYFVTKTKNGTPRPSRYAGRGNPARALRADRTRRTCIPRTRSKAADERSCRQRRVASDGGTTRKRKSPATVSGPWRERSCTRNLSRSRK